MWHKIKQCPEVNLQYLAAIISFAFSMLMISQTNLIHNDGILYLVTADAYLKDGLGGTLTFYEWPVYAIFIATVHQLCGFSLEFSAHFLNALLISAFIMVFLQLIREFGASKNAFLFAIPVILCFPFLNEIRINILRDFGFLCFVFLGFYQLIRFNKQPNWLNGLVWWLAMLMAILFRAEALVLVLILPLSILCQRHITLLHRTLSYAYLHGLSLAIAAIVILIIFLQTDNILGLLQSGITDKYRLFADIQSSSFKAAEIVRNDLLPQYSSSVAIPFLGGGLLVILFTKTVTTMGLQHIFALYLGNKYYPVKIPPHVVWPYIFLISGTFLIIITSLLKLYFLQSRYTLSLVISLLLLLPFAIEGFYLHCKRHNKITLFKLLMGLLLIYNCTDGFISFGKAKTHITDAIQWIQKNTPEHSSLYTNNRNIAYQSARNIDWPDILFNDDRYSQQSLITKKHYDYYAMLISRKKPELLIYLQQHPRVKIIKTFKNKRNHQVAIYKLINPQALNNANPNQ